MTALSFSPQLDLVDAIPAPFELLSQLPLSEKARAFIERSRQTIKDIVQGKQRRRLLIIGPCSIHDVESVYEYAERLKELQKEVADSFFIVMRTYFEKPRTVKGWKGLLYDPFLDGSYDVAAGLRLSRKILVELADMQVPTGCELLEITTAPYLADLLSWGCIGARTCASAPHRQLAASLDMAIGFKNATNGCLTSAINGIVSAAEAHVFLGVQEAGQLTRIQAKGNPYCHLVLRGSDGGPNYDPLSVIKALKLCRLNSISERILIDCSHGNCGKQHELQSSVFESVSDYFLSKEQTVMGAMLESHLLGGAQGIGSSLKYGVSVTDPCLDWQTTKSLIQNAHARLDLLRH